MQNRVGAYGFVDVLHFSDVTYLPYIFQSAERKDSPRIDATHRSPGGPGSGIIQDISPTARVHRIDHRKTRTPRERVYLYARGPTGTPRGILIVT